MTKHYRKSIEKLRKKELKSLSSVLPDDEYKKLQGAMLALRKDSSTLTEKE